MPGASKRCCIARSHPCSMIRKNIERKIPRRDFGKSSLRINVARKEVRVFPIFTINRPDEAGRKLNSEVVLIEGGPQINFRAELLHLLCQAKFPPAGFNSEASNASVHAPPLRYLGRGYAHGRPLSRLHPAHGPDTSRHAG